uniref:Uncharacterized protein n=1 Tax=Solanum tuberosum TaxID=4113 RepID=M1CLG4_SOLTU
MSRVSSLYTWKLLQILETQHVAGNLFRNPKMGCIHTVYNIYTLIYRFRAENTWPKMRKYRDEVKYRCSEEGDTRKGMIYLPIYTNKQPVYTKTELV